MSVEWWIRILREWKLERVDGGCQIIGCDVMGVMDVIDVMDVMDVMDTMGVMDAMDGRGGCDAGLLVLEMGDLDHHQPCYRVPQKERRPLAR